ncbi:MAG: hypothetical protein ACK4IX_14200 [Candidatus Sericytochromatia bacterium]
MYKNKKIDYNILKNAFVISLSIIIFTLFTSDINYYYGLIISLPFFSMIAPFLLYIILKSTLSVKKLGKKVDVNQKTSDIEDPLIKRTYIILCSISISGFINIFIILFQEAIFGPLHP